MKKKATYLSVVIAYLILSVALLACGPATQSTPVGQPDLSIATQTEETTSQKATAADASTPTIQPETPERVETAIPATAMPPTARVTSQETQPDPAPTPTPTPTPTPAETYPKLDLVLQKLVGKFDAGELTEAQAAEQAPEHHGSTVLVEIDTSAESIDAVDAWMGEQEITLRFKDADYVPPHIYAYVQVSELGDLSKRDGISMVWAVEDPGAGFREPQGVLRQKRSGTPPKAKLPLWMKDYPYPKLTGDLEEFVYRYEQGELTAAQVAESYDHRKGTSIDVQIGLQPDPANTDAVAAWLRKNDGVSDMLVKKHEVLINTISVFVPVSLLAELSELPGVYWVRVPNDLGNSGYYPLPLTPADDEAQSAPPPTPTPVVSQGFDAHGATAWDGDGYDGTGVNVGVIDQNFKGFGKLMGKDLPQAVEAQCYLPYSVSVSVGPAPGSGSPMLYV